MAVDQEMDHSSDLESDINIVGAQKSSKILIVIVLLLVVSLGYYFFFSGDSEKKDEATTEIKKEDIDKLIKESVPVAQEVAPRVSMPTQLPELPALVAPPVPETPAIKPMVLELPKVKLPSSIAPPSVPVSDVKFNSSLPPPPSSSPISSPVSGYNKERRSSSMLLMAGRTGRDGTTIDEDGNVVVNKGRLALDDFAPLEKTGAEQARATKVGRLDYMVAQGKMLDAVLETAINSDLDGSLRAIISRDIYAESGSLVMIPKGSRLIGEYTYDESDGNHRVDITWKRVLLPHGVDIDIDSPGVDELGRKGLTGVIDDKISNILMTSLLIMGISVGTASIVSQIPGMNQNITISTDPTDPNFGKETTTSTLPFNIITQSINDVSSSLKGVVKRYEDTRPTIYIDQGTLVKVFVMKDLIFPPEAVSKVSLIQ